MDSTSKNQFDVGHARSQFPFFSVADNRDISFFDNAAGTFSCGAVIEYLNHFYLHNKVQPYPLNALGEAAGKQMDKGRSVLADLLGLDQSTITIGASTTQNFNTLSIACSKFIHQGDEVIVSEQDHESNIGSWERFCRLNGVTLKFWNVDEVTGELDLSDLEKLLTEKTKLVSITHSSNILGSVNPIHEISEKVHSYGAKFIVDGVSFAPHHWPDIPSYGVDAYCFSTYKTFGTHHGVMYISPDFMQDLAPQCHFFNEGSEPWKRLDSSGPDHASIAALAGLGDLFVSIHSQHFGSSEKNLHQISQEVATLMHQHESRLGQIILEGVKDLPFRLMGKDKMENREANFSVLPLKGKSLDLISFLGKHKTAASNGHFYAYRLLKKMGLQDMQDGVVRISLANYNTEPEVKKLIELLGQYFSEL